MVARYGQKLGRVRKYLHSDVLQRAYLMFHFTSYLTLNNSTLKSKLGSLSALKVAPSHTSSSWGSTVTDLLVSVRHKAIYRLKIEIFYTQFALC